MPASLLPLKGGRNLRDMGGLTARDGRRLRHGHLFRSGSLHELDPASIAALKEMGLRTICDFRAPDERAEQPTPSLGDQTEILEWEDAQELTHRGLAEGETSTRDDGRRAILRVYEQLPVLHIAKYRTMFARLMDGYVPLLFHCAAGKDRTGVAAALILIALDIPRDAILEDYAASERLVEYLDLYRGDAARNPESVTARYLQKPEPFVSAVLASHPDYLAHSLDLIAGRWGSVDDYLEQEMGVNAAGRQRLCDLLLE
ncbi:MAG: tyrosine-protein phosphatase [Novosphingobium sp.]